VEAKQLDLSYTAVKAPFTERTSQRMVRAGNLVGSGDNAMLTSVLQDDPMCETADYSLRIWFDADTLKELGVTAQEAVTAIRDQNTQVAAGQIGAAPAPQGTSREYTINVNGRLADPEEFEQIFIKTSKVGRLVQVKDVGRGELGSEDSELLTSVKWKRHTFGSFDRDLSRPIGSAK